MSRGSFSRTVARAAASGGSRAYRGRSPRGWYVLLAAICIAGVFLVVYSRNERLHPASAASVPPTAADHWYTAVGFDLCGKVQPNLAASTNFSTVGIRTAGDGVISIAPGAASNASAFSGKNDTLGTFATYYSGLTITPRSLQLPGMSKPLANGDECTAAIGPDHGVGRLVLRTWASPKAKSSVSYTGDPASLELENGMMVMIGFVPTGTKLPEPRSRTALVAYLNGSTIAPTPSTPTTTVPLPTSTTTAGSRAGATTTSPGATTTSPGATTTSPGATTTSKAR